MGVWRIGTNAKLRGWRQTRRRTKARVGRIGAQLLHAHLNGWVAIGSHAHRHDGRISERSVRKAGVPLGTLA